MPPPVGRSQVLASSPPWMPQPVQAEEEQEALPGPEEAGRQVEASAWQRLWWAGWAGNCVSCPV